MCPLVGYGYYDVDVFSTPRLGGEIGSLAGGGLVSLGFDFLVSGL